MPRPFVRVRDKETRHEFDVREGDPRIGSLLELVRKPHYSASPVPRPAKHHLNLAGRSASRETAPATAGPEEATAKESHDG